MYVIEFARRPRTDGPGAGEFFYVRDDSSAPVMIGRTTDIDRARVWLTAREAYAWAAQCPKLEAAKVVAHPMRGVVSERGMRAYAIREEA